MGNALLVQQAAAPVAFDHEHISAGVPGVGRRALVPGLTLVELPFLRGSVLGIIDLLQFRCR